MFVSVDESGDSGFKIGKGSSEYFIVASIFVTDPIQLSSSIDELRYKLHISKLQEFKFNKADQRLRQAFFEELRRHDVSIRGFSVNKRLLLEQHQFRSKSFFYNSLLERALVRNRSDMIDATLVLDEFMSDRASQRALTSCLRQALQEEVEMEDGTTINRLKEIKHLSSKSDNLIQAADMVAGAIHVSRSRQDDAYLEILRARIHEIWDWHGDD